MIASNPAAATGGAREEPTDAAQACSQCGNVYDKSFQLSMRGQTYTFDCFECAIALLAPSCDHCKVRIIGHGLESDGRLFCCDHCAEQRGVTNLRDRS
jgi:hypothetical protein